MDMARIQLAGDGGVDLVALQDICEQADPSSAKTSSALPALTS